MSITLDPRRLRSRQSLTEALSDLLESKTLESITIEEITERAGVSRPTFYSNYEDRQSIILEHVQEWLAERRAAYLQIEENPNLTPLEGSERHLQQVIEDFDPADRILRLAISGRAGDAVLQAMRQFSIDIVKIRVRYSGRDDIGPAEIQRVAIFYGAAINGMLEAYASGEISMKPKALAKAMAQMIHSGVGEKFG